MVQSITAPPRLLTSERSLLAAGCCRQKFMDDFSDAAGSFPLTVSVELSTVDQFSQLRGYCLMFTALEMRTSTNGQELPNSHFQ